MILFFFYFTSPQPSPPAGGEGEIGTPEAKPRGII